jgi:uncharacterized protein
MRLLRVLLVLVLGGLVLRTLVGPLEPRLVFLPFTGEDTTPAALGLRYEQVSIETADGERLIAWHLLPDEPIADIVYFKGNGGNLSVWLPVLAALHRQHLRVFAVDYRGYGLSTGRPTEEGVYRDAEAVVRHVERLRGADPAIPLVFWGRSLGGPVAASATRAVMPDALILESTFPDKAAVIRRNPVLRLLNVFFGAYRFATAEMLRDFSRPVLVMHGDRDRVIPFALGQELYAQIAAPKRFAPLAGADHNDFFDPGDRAYWAAPLELIAGLRVRPEP